MKRAALLLALALGACAGPRPGIPLDAHVAPPPSWREPSQAEDRVDPLWWQTFGDPVLTDLVQRSLAGNADLGIATARVEAARAQFSLASAERLPNVWLAAGGGRDRHVNPFGRAVEEWAGQGQVAVSYDLDLFGRLRNAGSAARAELLGSEASRDNVRLAIAASVALGYIGLRSLDARLDVVRSTLAAREASLKLVRRRAAAGYSSALDLRQAQAEYDATAQQVPAIEFAIRRQENGLSLLLGIPPGPIPRGMPIAALKAPTINAVLPSALLRRRPDIASAEQQLVAADRTLDSVRAAFLPDIELNGAAGYVASSLLTSDPISIFSIGQSILAPLFDSGRLRARQHGAAAQRDAAAYTYRKTALNAFREVEDALAAVASSTDQERDVERQRESTAALLALAKSRYGAGYSTFFEQIDAERGLLSTDLALIEARAERLGAAVALYQALGGGWDASKAPGPVQGAEQ